MQVADKMQWMQYAEDDSVYADSGQDALDGDTGQGTGLNVVDADTGEGADNGQDAGIGPDAVDPSWTRFSGSSQQWPETN